jgi:hypothetical protein
MPVQYDVTVTPLHATASASIATPMGTWTESGEYPVGEPNYATAPLTMHKDPCNDCVEYTVSLDRETMTLTATTGNGITATPTTLTSVKCN